MSDFGNKISELNPLSAGNMAGEIPLSLTLSSGTLATNKITLSQLRDLFDFDSAYSSVEEGIAATVENQMFYVYVDNNKLSVNEYVRTSIGANAVIGKSGTKKIIYIPALLKHVKVQVESFAALREFKPWWEGQVVYLKGYYEGSTTGGGDFVGHLGTATDDGGTVASGAGFYWERVVKSSYLNPNDFGAKEGIAAFDSGPAFRNAISAAKRIGLNHVFFQGNYWIKSFDTVNYVLPFDDGSIDPIRITNGSDSTLQSETTASMPVFINLPSVVSLTSDKVEESSLNFSFDSSIVGNITLNQGIGICARVDDWDGTYLAQTTNVNRMSAFVTGNKISGFTINQALIGYLSDGVQHFAKWDEMRFRSCGFPMILQGADCCNYGSLSFISCYSGVTIGGFWLQRNDVQWRGGLYIPPYTTGTDIFSIGWCDDVHFDKIIYQGKDTFNSFYAALDDFFDTYFWKTASATARLSKKGPDRTTDSTLLTVNPFRGITGRAVMIQCRYNRDSGGNLIDDLKVFYAPRVPVFINPAKTSDWGTNIIIRQAFIEQSCVYIKGSTSNTAAGGTNDFYAVANDKWNSDRTSAPFNVLEGPGAVNNVKFTSSILTQVSEFAPPVLSPKQYNYVYAKDLNSIEYLRRTAIKTDDGGWLVAENLMADKYQLNVPIIFSARNTNPILYFKQLRKALSYAPVIYNGTINNTNGTAITNWRGTVELQSGKVIVKFRIVLPTDIESASGVFAIGFRELNNFYPYESATGKWSSEYTFFRLGAISFSTTGLTKGNVQRVIRTYAAPTNSVTENNFVLKYGQDSSSDSVLCSDLKNGSILSFEFEYDTDARSLNI